VKLSGAAAVVAPTAVAEAMPLVLGTPSGMPGWLPAGPSSTRPCSVKARKLCGVCRPCSSPCTLAVCGRAAAGRASPPACMPPVLPATAAGGARNRDGGTFGGR
jgi:hypothetical protein